jgi:N utilization substance protein B
MSSKRRYTREKVMQVLYAHEMTKDPIKKVKYDLLRDLKDKDSIDFANDLIEKTLENQVDYESMIKDTVKNWELDRIALLDTIIIKMCISEFLYFEEIPPKVSINEAIDIAKDYSTRNSGKFVNGILDSILGNLQKNKKIHKTGKGLVESSMKYNKPDNLEK